MTFPRTQLEQHPDYQDELPLWVIVRDAYDGEKIVKEKTTAYLPKPQGFESLGTFGQTAYAAYMMRANFPDVMSLTIRRLTGLMSRKPTEYKLPSQLEGMRENATLDGLTLEGLHMRLIRELLITGRYGLLPDMPVDGGNPYIAGYEAERIVNWGERGGSVQFVHLDESDDDYDETTLAWELRNKSRLLQLTGGAYTVTIRSDGADDEMIMPAKQGAGGPLTRIPFVFVNSNDLTAEPGEIPLIGLSRTAVSIYRLDADYRHQLFNSGQEFYAFIGLEKEDMPEVVGAGVSVALPLEGDAKVVGPTGTGIDAHRTAIRDEFDRAVTQGAQLLQEQKVAESGDALRLRFSSTTSTLTVVAKVAAAGLERALRNLAEWLGADPDSVSVTPNLDFVDAGLTPDELRALVESWMKGAISGPTLHQNLQQGEIVAADRTYEDERKLIEDVERMLGASSPTATKPDASVITALVNAYNAGLAPPEVIISYFRATKLVPDSMTDAELLQKALGLATPLEDADLGRDQLEPAPASDPFSEASGGNPPQPNPAA